MPRPNVSVGSWAACWESELNRQECLLSWLVAASAFPLL